MMRRFGRFIICRKGIDDFSTNVKRIMGKCIIIRAQMLYECDAIEYYAISEHFDLLEPGTIPPTYEWHIDSDGYITCERKPY